MSDPKSTEVIPTHEELTDADLEEVAGGVRPSTSSAVHIHDLNITKKTDVSSAKLLA